MKKFEKALQEFVNNYSTNEITKTNLILDAYYNLKSDFDSLSVMNDKYLKCEGCYYQIRKSKNNWIVKEF